MRILRPSLATALVIISVISGVAAPAGDGRQLLNIDSGWKFLAGDDPHAQDAALDDAAWQQVDLPHTWNGLDGQEGGNGYRRGAGWYRRHLSVDPSLAGKRLYLQFDGASLMADVYVNGIHLGNHKGGFAKFRFDATDALHADGDNVIAVRVDNSKLGIPPASSDFTIFGGLYRAVWLLSTDPVQVSVMDMGSPGVFIEQGKVSDTSANVTVRAELENHGPTPRVVGVKVTIQDADRVIVASSDASLRVNVAPGGLGDVVIPLSLSHPHLWNARANPYLYTVRVELRPFAADGAQGALSDAVEQPLGLRSFSVDPDKGFFLNGEYLNLYGFNRHQDWPDKGWAISDDEEAVDFDLMMDIGATAVRVSHYQQSDSWYDRCDRGGLVAWAEIPSWGTGLATPEYLESAKQQLRELIRQNFNHPSICFWSVGNETKGPAADSVIVALAPVVREEDPTRLSIYASDHEASDPKNWHTDVVAFNRYLGWYKGTLADFGPFLDKTHADYPKACFGMSEFGAGASINQHTDSTAQPAPRGLFHPEEYQNLTHETYWGELKKRPFVWCKFIWCLHDFASAGRNEGDHPGRNDKGVVTYDRKVKKDSFYFYKANWSPAPVLHVTSCRFVDRVDPVTEIKVYSNAPEVTLELNGVSLGAKKDPNGDRIFRWPGVTLSPGENRVVAKADFESGALADSCVWTLRPR